MDRSTRECPVGTAASLAGVDTFSDLTSQEAEAAGGFYSPGMA